MKNFLNWIKLKKKTHYSRGRVSFQEREIWMCYFGENIGFESNGKNNLFHRPVLVLHKFNKNLFYGIPLSTKIKNNKFYIKINFQKREQSVMISQTRSLSAKRLHYKKGRMNSREFNFVKKEFLKIFTKK